MEFVVGDGAFGRAEIRDNNFTVPAGEIGMTYFARSEGFGGTNGRLDVTLEGNTINGISSGGLFIPGIQFLAGASTGTHDQDMCVNAATSAGAGNNVINGTNSPGLTPKFEVRQRTGTSFFLQGFAGNGTVRRRCGLVLQHEQPGRDAGRRLRRYRRHEHRELRRADVQYADDAHAASVIR